MSEPNKKKLVIVDTSALMHRAYHALPPLTTAGGKMVNAVYGFTSVFLKMAADLKPDYVVCAFDVAAPTFRKEKFDEYKAHRVKAPQEFYDQIPDIKRVIAAFGVPMLERPGFEADDIIGTLSDKYSREKDLEIIIVTGDLDTLQLVNGVARVYTLKKGIMDTVVYSRKEVVERFGIEPKHLIDYKGLRGDPSDNIPGVPGVGEKTASKIIQKFENLENLYKLLDEKSEEEVKKGSENLIKGKVYKNLKDFKEQAFFSRELATIRRDVPVDDFDLAKAKWNSFDKEKAIALFKEFEFWSLVNRIRDFGVEKKGVAAEKAGEKDKTSLSDKCEVISNSRIADFVALLSRQKEIAIKFGQSADLFGGGENYFSIAIDKNGDIRNFLVPGNLSGQLKKILENKDIKKISYDFKSDLKSIWELGTDPSGIYFDIMVAAYLVLAGQRDYSLEKLIFSETGKDAALMKENIAGFILHLKNIYEKKLSSLGMDKLFFEVEMPLVEVLAKMEKTGIRIDKDFLAKMSGETEKKLESIAGIIYDIAGEKFNVNSPQQLSKILFEKLQISAAGIGKTEKGKKRSTAAAELAKLSGRHKIVDYISEYRELAKLKNTYLDTLPSLVGAKDGRLHTSFNQTITTTGRLSSSDPNLQNIPVKTDLGNMVRRAFIADEGYRLVSFDYSQIELRLAASLAKDEKMIGIFKQGGDIHVSTAAIVSQTKESEVTPEMRQNAKALNFGVIYGISPYGFAKSAGISNDEAKDFIENYMAKFSGISKYLSESMEKARRKGYAETLLGRRRYLPDLESPNMQVRRGAERMAINMPIQGMAADMIKLAMIRVYPIIDSEARLLLQVHDELLFEIKEEKSDHCIEKIKNIMETVYNFDAPIKVDVKIGVNWGEMDKIS